MQRYVAFLRGMNLGKRRITNEELCARVSVLGFSDVSAFLASGNVFFAADHGTAEQVATRVRDGLRAALDYDVPTFVRTVGEVEAIAAYVPFDVAVGQDGGKLQVALLGGKPTAAARRKALALATNDDRLAVHGRELYWLPRGKITESELDLKAIERALGPMTFRTGRTLERIAARLAG